MDPSTKPLEYVFPADHRGADIYWKRSTWLRPLDEGLLVSELVGGWMSLGASLSGCVRGWVENADDALPLNESIGQFCCKIVVFLFLL